MTAFPRRVAQRSGHERNHIMTKEEILNAAQGLIDYTEDDTPLSTLELAQIYQAAAQIKLEELSKEIAP